MQKYILLTLLMLLWLSCIVASPNKALIISNQYENVGSNLTNINKLEELKGLLKRHGFDVTFLNNRELDDLDYETEKFVNSLDDGDVVFIYLLGYGVQENNKSMYITHDKKKWDIKENLIKPIDTRSTRLGMPKLAPFVVYDLLYENQDITGSMSKPMERIVVNPDVFVSMYSHKPGENSKAGESIILIKLSDELKKDNFITLRGLLANVVSATIEENFYGQHPVLAGDTAFPVYLNLQGSGPLPPPPPPPPLPSSCKKRLLEYSKMPEAYVVGVGAVGGALYILSRFIDTKPKELPNPPMPPGN